MKSVEKTITNVFEESRKKGENIKDGRVFDLWYIPSDIYVRNEIEDVAKELADYFIHDIQNNICIVGSRGSGKTVSIRNLTNILFKVDQRARSLYLNAREDYTTYKLYQKIIHEDKRGFSLQEMRKKAFDIINKPKTILIIDEIDFLKDDDILYDISRLARCNLILLTQKAFWYRDVDESIRSSLQASIIYFRDYNPDEIYQILKLRCKDGLKEYDDEALGLVSAIIKKDHHSDIRIGIRALYHLGQKNKWSKSSINTAIEKASKDVEGNIISELGDKELLVLESVIKTKDTNKAYSNLIKKLEKDYFGETISRRHFLRILNYLQNVGLILLIKKRAGRYYTYEVEPLSSIDLINDEIVKRG